MKLRYYLYIFAYIAVILLSIVLAGQDWSVIARPEIWAARGVVYQFWGFFAAVLLLIVTVTEYKIRRPKSLTDTLVIIMPAVVGFAFIGYIIPFGHITHDWRTFHESALAIMEGGDPYSQRLYQSYPPPALLLIQQTYFLSGSFTTFIYGEPLEDYSLWNIVFFVRQSLVWSSYIAIYLLMYQYGKRLGMKRIISALVSCGILITAFPVTFDIYSGQFCSWVLVSLMIGILLEKHSVAGMFPAIGVLIKIHPICLAWPWLLKRRWKPIAIGAITIAAAFLAMYLTDNWWLWERWLNLWTNDVHYNITARNNNTAGIINFFFLYLPMKVTRNDVNIIIISALCLHVIWFLGRAYVREVHGDKDYEGHIADAIVLPLFLSPDNWAYTFVFVIPFVMYAIARYGRKYPLLILIAVALLFCFTNPQIYPIGHTRMVGLLILYVMTSPRRGSP